MDDLRNWSPFWELDDFCIRYVAEFLTLKLPGGGQMALPLGILAYGSQKKEKCVIVVHVNLVYKKCDE